MEEYAITFIVDLEGMILNTMIPRRGSTRSTAVVVNSRAGQQHG
jgi:hypothetical protein